jgi:hypothetical protein
MIIDNKSNFLYEIFQKNDIKELQILTPFITLYGFELIQKKLNSNTKILLSDSIDKILGISEELKYKNQLKQTYLAKKFADFIQKIEIKSIVQKSLSILNFINKEFITSIQGNFDLSLAGLGKVGSQNYYTNILVKIQLLGKEKHQQHCWLFDKFQFYLQLIFFSLVKNGLCYILQPQLQ